MVTLCWAAKGGSGTTVVATTLALNSPRTSLLVDLDGEVPVVLGLPQSDRPGVGDWLTSDAPPEHLADLLVDVADRTWILPWRSSVSDTSVGPATGARWEELGSWLAGWARERSAEVVIDAGTGEPERSLFDLADRRLLVTRPCYLSLRRAVRSDRRPTGIVLVEERGRSLSRHDIEHALGAPVEATVSLDPSVARAVDAGLLLTRFPRIIGRELRRVAA